MVEQPESTAPYTTANTSDAAASMTNKAAAATQRGPAPGTTQGVKKRTVDARKIEKGTATVNCFCFLFSLCMAAFFIVYGTRLYIVSVKFFLEFDLHNHDQTPDSNMYIIHQPR